MGLIHHPSTTPPAKTASPAQFFEEILVEVLRARSEAASLLAGRVMFEVVGLDGGCWLIDLGAQQVLRGGSARPDCCFSLRSADFAQLLKGSLDVSAAIREGRVIVSGDFDAAERFVRLLSP